MGVVTTLLTPTHNRGAFKLELDGWIAGKKVYWSVSRATKQWADLNHEMMGNEMMGQMLLKLNQQAHWHHLEKQREGSATDSTAGTFT